MDEYEYTQEPAWHFAHGRPNGQHLHNPKKIRRAILNRLREELGEGPNPIFYAQRAVRDATAQALRERLSTDRPDARAEFPGIFCFRQ